MTTTRVSPRIKVWRTGAFIIMLMMITACQFVGGTPGAGYGEQTTPITYQREISVGPGPFYMTDTRSGLEQLANYMITLMVSFEGTQAGNPDQWSITFQWYYTAEPALRQVWIENSGYPDDLLPVFMGEQYGISYQMETEGQCSAQSVQAGEPSPMDLFEPTFLVPSVLGAQATGQEMIGDQAADHFAFDQQSLDIADLQEAAGDVWTATDGGPLLIYQLSMTAGAGYFGEGIQGTLTWDYSLTDINTTVPPDMPVGCQLDVPMLSDARDVFHVPYWLAYNTDTSVTEAVGFYRDQLSAAGWKQLSARGSGGDFSYLEFEREEIWVGIFIFLEENATSVNAVRLESTP